MAERKKIAILFIFTYSGATGLTIYLLNIIRILKTLPDERIPHLVILYTTESPVQEVEQIKYPYISFYALDNAIAHLPTWKRIINKSMRTMTKRNVFEVYAPKHPFPSGIDTIYPYFDTAGAEYIADKIYWKADFQEKYYPEFFPESDLQWSEAFLRNISSLPNTLVLSSNDAFNDFKKFCPGYQSQVKLLQFASFLPDFSNLDAVSIKAKYKIDKPYFIVANQFWPHKNHITVLKALLEMEDKGCLIVFTGKTGSYRNQNYLPQLLEYIDEHRLNEYVRVLGFIDRSEQLLLMKNSLAVVQPTLFEGWSTVIEDAKALNKYVIASGLSVNREQLSCNAVFFESLDFIALAGIMQHFLEGKYVEEAQDYTSNLFHFREQVTDILSL